MAVDAPVLAVCLGRKMGRLDLGDIAPHLRQRSAVASLGFGLRDQLLRVLPLDGLEFLELLAQVAAERAEGVLQHAVEMRFAHRCTDCLLRRASCRRLWPRPQTQRCPCAPASRSPCPPRCRTTPGRCL